MELAGVALSLGLESTDPTLLALYQALSADTGDPLAPRDWRMLGAALARSLMSRTAPAAVPWPAWDEVAPPLVLGIAGGQGSGKTTLARQLVRALAVAGARAADCSLDDFYLSRSRRAALADTVHPLLATRGVPGTHDVALLRRTIAELGAAGTMSLPVFDKAADDLLPPSRWRRVQAPVDVLVLEGWCLGARPLTAAELIEPVNRLEADEDRDGVWRRYVNDALAGPYAGLWRELHALIYLEVPDMSAVARWREQQEGDLAAERRMSRAELRRFIAHYERITRAMQDDLPGRASLLVRLGRDHTVTEIRRNPRLPARE